jgi:hypothetical protein
VLFLQLLAHLYITAVAAAVGLMVDPLVLAVMGAVELAGIQAQLEAPELLIQAVAEVAVETWEMAALEVQGLLLLKHYLQPLQQQDHQP